MIVYRRPYRSVFSDTIHGVTRKETTIGDFLIRGTIYIQTLLLGTNKPGRSYKTKYRISTETSHPKSRISKW